MDTWVSQMLLYVFTICAGVAAFLQTRTRRHGAGASETKAEKQPATATPSGTILNGYADVLQKALDKAEWWRDQAHRFEMRNGELEQHVAELERQLDECRRQQRTRRSTTTTRKRPPKTHTE
jgi:hypothetical protein